MSPLLKRLEAISVCPDSRDQIDAWLESEDVDGLLREHAVSDEVILYAALPHAFLHTILVPRRLVSPPDVEDLMSWNCGASSSWGITTRYSNPPETYISPPLDHTGSKTLDQGEQLVFARFFEGYVSDKNYYELLQRFIHVSGLHFVEERSAFCELDDNGDLVDVIRIMTLGSGKTSGHVVVCRRQVLEQYMALTDASAIVTFDFTKWRSGNFSGWPHPLEPIRVQSGNVTYDKVVCPRIASYVRGYQQIHPTVTAAELAKQFAAGPQERDTDKQYASFIAYDWKNGEITEISCAPGATANYFTKSDLPFEVTPAFFRAEVLTKYKTDTAKYRLKDRSIYCRGAWFLKTYDINEAGQVHTYIVYLRDLPYQEQLYWKAFNEPPKAGISKRAFKSDFEASWDFEYDPLPSLKNAIDRLEEHPVEWWTLRSADLPNKVHYPTTSSPDDWANEILKLDQLVVEGFQEKWLRERAESAGTKPDPKFGSLKLTELCLVAAGCEPDQAIVITAPLKELHGLRTKLKGHASGGEALEIRKQMLLQHGSLAAHFRDLCRRCDESFRKIGRIFQNPNSE